MNKLNYVIVAVLLIELGAFGALSLKRMGDIERQAAERETQRIAREADKEKRDAAKALTKEPAYRDGSKHACNAGNNTITCYVTNLEEVPIVSCMQGLIQQKEATGVRLYSNPMCSGLVPPLTTVVLTTTWSQGTASDICTNGRFLDWDKCDFTTIDYNPQTHRKPQPAP